MHNASSKSLVVVTALSCALASSSCGLFGQTRRGPQYADGRGPGGARTFSDSDVVTSVAATSTDVFVGTLRGVLRYAPGGAGEPTRFTTAQGLPDDRVFAMSVSPDGITWAATARGVVRLMGDRWMTAGGTQPDVGRPTALLALGGGQVLLGGATGLARYDGSRWVRLSERYQVMALAPMPGGAGGALVATAQTGVLVLNEDFNAVDEHGASAGIPDALARAVVGVGGGRLWALVQGPSGSRLAHYDGHRWYGYTHGEVRAPWITLVPVRSGAAAALVTRDGVHEIVSDGGVALVATDAGPSDQRQRVALRPEGVDPPPPLPGGPASARGGGASNSGGGGADMVVREAPIQPRNVPGFAPPTEVPTPGGNTPAVQAPRFALAPLAGAPPAARAGDAVGAFADATGALYLAREGRGVARIAGGSGAMDYRASDLALTRRPLSLATDGRGNVWLVTDQGGAVRFDGRRFVRASIDPNPEVVPLLFWSRGPVAAAVARQGANNLVAYRFADNEWQMVTARRIDAGTPGGTMDARFLAVDERNRFWVGLRVTEPNGTAHDRGVVLIDGNLPSPTYFRTRPRRGRGPRGLVPAPDDVSAIDFDSRGTAWLASVSGAVAIGPGRTPRERASVRMYGEAQGVRGDLVADLVRGPSGNIWLVTPEGVGYHDGQSFTFGLEGASAMPPATALAADNAGALWAVGPRGAWSYDGNRFRRLGASDGIPEGTTLTDVAVDGENRVWLTSGAAITIIDRASASGGNGSGSGEGSSGGSSSLSGL